MKALDKKYIDEVNSLRSIGITSCINAICTRLLSSLFHYSPLHSDRRLMLDKTTARAACVGTNGTFVTDYVTVPCIRIRAFAQKWKSHFFAS